MYKSTTKPLSCYLATQQSPCKALLNEVHHRLRLHRSYGTSHFISQPTRSANRDAHGADLFFDLLGEQGQHVRPSSVHSHRGAVVGDVAWVPGPRNKDIEA
ncbi:hypothetical protein IL306_009881, partial [Fusarium sp. DS 682]